MRGAIAAMLRDCLKIGFLAWSCSHDYRQFQFRIYSSRQITEFFRRPPLRRSAAAGVDDHKIPQLFFVQKGFHMPSIRFGNSKIN